MCSLALLLRSLTNQDQTYVMMYDGILGHLECSFWNQGVLIWGGFLASTYNLLCLTIERYIYSLFQKLKLSYLNQKSELIYLIR